MLGWRCFPDGSVEPVEVDDYMIIHDRVINDLLVDITDMIHDIHLLHGDKACDQKDDHAGSGGGG